MMKILRKRDAKSYAESEKERERATMYKTKKWCPVKRKRLDKQIYKRKKKR